MAAADFGVDGRGPDVKIIHAAAHAGQRGFQELRGQDWVPMADSPERVGIILAALAERGLRDVQAAVPHGPGAILRVHDAGFVHFLEHCHAVWAERYGTGSAAFARMFGMRGLAQVPDPANINAMLAGS